MQNIKPQNLIAVPTGLLQIQNLPINIKPIKFSLVIPTYNEKENIQQLITSLIQVLDEIVPQEYELIVVDDDSSDRTWKNALEMSIKYPQVKTARRKSEKGLATAVVRGWQTSRGKILGVIDADSQHPPQILTQLWQEMEKGADLAIASRNVAGGGVSEWNMARRFLSRGAQGLGLLILPEVMRRISDPMSGYFLVRRDAVMGMILQPLGYKILVEVMARGRIRWISEVGYVFQERKRGESKVRYRQYFEYVRHLLRLRLDLWQSDRLIGFGTSFSSLSLKIARSKINSQRDSCRGNGDR